MIGDDVSAPGADVLRAFGVGESEPVLLTGGRGLTWRAGQVVLRPHDGPRATDWRADVLSSLEHGAGFRAPRPVASRDGGWRSGDWEAWEFVDGAADESRVEDVIRAGRAFHRAIADLSRPGFLTARARARATATATATAAADPWAHADRMAWGEEPLPPDPTLDRLAAAFRPVHAPSQLVHGDLLGNVLFAEGHAPAIIDWPPYWRPAEYGSAIAAVDAVCWHGVPVGRLAALAAPGADDRVEWLQLLTRALVFRIATLHLLGAWDTAAAEHHRPVVDALVGRRTSTSPR